ncbi:MAG: hypothetical protein KF836_01325 [Fimbriimonadaceae bacterium]|nr:hypothetical protein [Fimbriimonadaceae bacterium]
MLDVEWQQLIDQMRRNAEVIKAWKPCPPNPEAERCEFCRHRTLAHFRACQETWLHAIQEFAAKPTPSVNLLHPWKSFVKNNYQLVSWDDHMTRFMNDRAAWLLLLESGVDRTLGGKLSRQPQTIESLTGRLVGHETHHIEVLHDLN